MYFDKYYTKKSLKTVPNSNIIINMFINKFIIKNKTYSNALNYAQCYSCYLNYNCCYDNNTMKILKETIN
jgi:hypothetical protein